jgi:hypothetical protein
LQLDGFEPGIFPRRLIKMTVNADVAFHGLMNDKAFKKFKPFKPFKTIARVFDGLNVLNGLNGLNRPRTQCALTARSP